MPKPVNGNTKGGKCHCHVSQPKFINLLNKNLLIFQWTWCLAHTFWHSAYNYYPGASWLHDNATVAQVTMLLLPRWLCYCYPGDYATVSQVTMLLLPKWPPYCYPGDHATVAQVFCEPLTLSWCTLNTKWSSRFQWSPWDEGCLSSVASWAVALANSNTKSLLYTVSESPLLTYYACHRKKKNVTTLQYLLPKVAFYSE